MHSTSNAHSQRACSTQKNGRRSSKMSRKVPPPNAAIPATTQTPTASSPFRAASINPDKAKASSGHCLDEDEHARQRQTIRQQRLYNTEVNTLRFACAMAERNAAKYSAASIRKASRCARSMRRQLRPGTEQTDCPPHLSCPDSSVRARCRCCRDQVRDLRRFAKQAVKVLLARAVGVRHALVLAQMLEPGFDEEGFHEALAVARCPRRRPTRRRRRGGAGRDSRSSAVRNASRLAPERRGTRPSPGPARRRPRRPGRRPAPANAWKAPGRCRRRSAASSASVSGIASSAQAAAMKWAAGRPGHARELAPERAAERHGAGEDGDVDREPAAADPFGQGELGRHVEVGDGRDPADAREQAGHERASRARAPRRTGTSAIAVPIAPRPRAGRGRASP